MVALSTKTMFTPRGCKGGFGVGRFAEEQSGVGTKLRRLLQAKAYLLWGSAASMDVTRGERLCTQWLSVHLAR